MLRDVRLALIAVGDGDERGVDLGHAARVLRASRSAISVVASSVVPSGVWT